MTARKTATSPRARKSAAAKKGAATARRRRDPLVKVEQQRLIVSMWTAGRSAQEIADELDLSRETVRRIRREALVEAVEDRDAMVAEARETELRRLDALMSAHWRRAFGFEVPVFDVDGDKLPLNLRVADVDAAKIVLACVDKRAKLLGLYAPVKVDARVRSELDAQIETLVEELEAKGLAKPMR